MMMGPASAMMRALGCTTVLGPEQQTQHRHIMVPASRIFPLPHEEHLTYGHISFDFAFDANYGSSSDFDTENEVDKKVSNLSEIINRGVFKRDATGFTIISH